MTKSLGLCFDRKLRISWLDSFSADMTIKLARCQLVTPLCLGKDEFHLVPDLHLPAAELSTHRCKFSDVAQIQSALRYVIEVTSQSTRQPESGTALARRLPRYLGGY